jgi:hypothetical protein
LRCRFPRRRGCITIAVERAAAGTEMSDMDYVCRTAMSGLVQWGV